MSADCDAVWLPFSMVDSATSIDLVGGKTRALARMAAAGLAVPEGGCIPASVYRTALREARLTERLALELNRKPFQEMRWEELWDASLRIRSWFARLPLPGAMEAALRVRLDDTFGDRPVAVRSSAPAEDGAATSFAGLHESYVGIAGADAILHHMRRVWASLWSDRALLYRQELGLRVEESAMAVVVQAFVEGRCSGVAFSRNPLAPDQGVVEAVRGRGESFVDGAVAPDRWLFDRASCGVLRCEPAAPEVEPCLTDSEVTAIFAQARELEETYGPAQDMEWTLAGDGLHILQTRPVSTPPPVDPHGADKRGWYLTLSRSLPELRRLHRVITVEILPAMNADAERFAREAPGDFTDQALVKSTRERQASVKRWVDAYWESCIPFAHGMRLFGEVYNEQMAPEDPHEFVSLFTGASLISVERNDALRQIGVQMDESGMNAELQQRVTRWLATYGRSLPAALSEEEAEAHVLAMARRMAKVDRRPVHPAGEALRQRFVESFSPEERLLAEELLEIATASYALRDNDNHFLEAVQAEEARALEEIGARLERGHVFPPDLVSALPVRPDPDELAAPRKGLPAPDPSLRGKQLVGQPSSPGLGTGPARLILNESDLFEVQEGEVLVCDAISPTMTFAVPLAAAIVERRGGMLIHGAIIAREYGIPCVTGVPDATRLIANGQTVAVDGYLGHVILRMGHG